MKNILSFLVLILLFACGQKTKEEIPESIRPVRAEKIKLSGGKDQHLFSGTAQSSKETNLSFRVAGNIRNLNVKLGDRVRTGQTIATIDAVDYSIQADQAIASQKGAEANLKSSQTQIKSAETQVKSAETQLITTKSTYQRIESLYENNSVPLSDFEQAKASYETAQSQYEAAKASLAAAKSNYNAAQTQVTSSVKQTQSAQNQVNYTRLIAPYSGVITAVNVEANELVNAGTPIAILSLETQPEVNVGVPEIFITKVKKEQKVNINFSVLPNQNFKGIVEEIAYAAGASPTYPVIVKIKNPSKEIRPGMAANVQFDFSNKETATKTYLVSPVKAVGEDAKGNFVFVIEKEEGYNYIAKRKNVKIGNLLPAGFEIKEGLKEGELVATAGLKSLLDGMKVKLME